MRLVAAELIESRQILPGQWIQSLHAPELASGSRAGQFVHVRTGDYSGLLLRRPFSINTADPATGIITIHFRAVGRGTDWLTRLRPGETLDMLGPLGRPFEVDPRSRYLLLIAGGLGIAGVRMLVDEAIRDGRQVVVLFGAATARDVYPSSLLPDEVEYAVATDDGSLGHPGLVTERTPADARGARPPCRRSARAVGRGQARAQARRRAPGSPRIASGASEELPPGRPGAEHGLCRRGVSRLRRHGRARTAPTRLPRGPGVRGR
jgi:NAD(P)H-flavin reductase